MNRERVSRGRDETEPKRELRRANADYSASVHLPDWLAVLGHADIQSAFRRRCAPELLGSVRRTAQHRSEYKHRRSPECHQPGCIRSSSSSSLISGPLFPRCRIGPARLPTCRGSHICSLALTQSTISWAAPKNVLSDAREHSPGRLPLRVLLGVWLAATVDPSCRLLSGVLLTGRLRQQARCVTTPAQRTAGRRLGASRPASMPLCRDTLRAAPTVRHACGPQQPGERNQLSEGNTFGGGRPTCLIRRT
jgi:hypothetical protein